ncbi:MAG: hypothetical protein QNK04_25610 [Myxococcota bacterium]|nr:hypothetical protein [Myxococcota bacterium]
MSRRPPCPPRALAPDAGALAFGFVLAALVWAAPSWAGTVNLLPCGPSQCADSIDSLSFDGQTWNVDFVRGSFDALTTGGTDTSSFPYFGDEPDSFAFAEAMRSALAGSPAVGVTSATTTGSPFFYLPVSVDDVSGTVSSVFTVFETGSWIVDTSGLAPVNEGAEDWWGVAQLVPEPGTASLLALGLAILVARGRGRSSP